MTGSGQQSLPFFQTNVQFTPDGTGWEGEVAAVADLDRLKKIALACNRCRLRGGCRQVVFGEGNPQTKIMLVGEGPGEQEDIQGRPFVGAAGQLLDKILNAIDLKREEVYIANIVKCRPPGNRIPADDEAAVCLHYLKAQIKIISPRIIICLGATATKGLLGSELRITKVRGEWKEKGGILYLPTYHPAALLRDPSKKREVWEDFKKVRETYLKVKGELR